MLTVFAISDLHGYLPEIPKCEMVLLGGDYAPTRNIDQQERFFKGEFSDWLQKIQAKYVIGIGGNHDFILQENPRLAQNLPWIYLQDTPIEIETIKIYGTPWTPIYHDWAFMKPEPELAEIYKQIPEGLDILLAHGPAYRFLDRTREGTHVGSYALLDRIREVYPDTVVCGHIHEARGIADNGVTRFFNVSHVTRDLEPKHNPVYIPLRGL